MKLVKVLRVLGMVIPLVCIVVGSYIAGMKIMVESALLNWGLLIIVIGWVIGVVISRIVKKLDPPPVKEQTEAEIPNAEEADKE